MKNYLHILISNTLFTIILLNGLYSSAQIGNIIWEDNFDSLNTTIWNADVGNGCEIGLCGWGNAELEYYRNENLSIEEITGESGNNALVFEAKRESIEGFEFTSGKVTSEGNLSVHYGLIEIRMQVPDVDTGLWPAAWLLGTANVTWPAKGEIDMMEMGHKDEEITNQGYPGTNQNNYVGGNAIFANEDGSVGSIAYDVNYNKPYVSSTSMANRFITYRLYWEPTELRLTVIDNGVENDLYEGPLPLSQDGVTSAFTKPFFLLMNLAVGGNFTDAATTDQVTAPLPSKMYVDYVRVYEWNGHGSVAFDYDELEEETGPFGVYTENTPTNNELSFGLDAEIYVWGETMQEGNTAPYEGNEVIAWETLNPNSWFGGGISSSFGRDMSGYVEDGSLKFNIKVPADLSFRIGITDNYTNEKWIEFPAGENNYGLVRNGDWSEVEIPLVDFAGLIAFQNINYMFAISSIDGAFPSTSVQIGIDNIVWDDGNPLTTTIDVTGISVSPTNSTLLVGETVQFNETITPSNATNQNVNWSSTNSSVATVSTNGLLTAISAGTTTITATTEDGNFTDTSAVTVNEETTTTAFIPDPSKKYYIDNPLNNLRLGANGSNDPYTTSTTTTGENVEWIITPSTTSDYYHIDCVGGVTRPRLRGDNTSFTDMNPTTSQGSWTKWMFTNGVSDNTYLLTTLGNTLPRLQVTNTGEVKMVTTASSLTWESFIFTEVDDSSSSIKIEAEDYTAMNGVQTQETEDDNTLNVGWIDSGDWLEYTVNIPTSGTYTINSRVASPNAGATAQYEVDESVLNTLSIPNTGGWQNWDTASTTLNLSAGTQTIRITSTGNGFNFNWFEIESGNTGAKSISEEAFAQVKLYPNPVVNQLTIDLGAINIANSIDIVSINGQMIEELPVLDSNTISFNTSNLAKGIYLVRVKSSGKNIIIKKFIK